MVHLFEKVCKTENNIYGIKEIQGENPFLSGPCVITILPTPTFIKDVNGSMRQVANLVNPDIDNEYDPNRRIMGIGFGDIGERFGRFTRPIPTNDELEEFVNYYFRPLFSENNTKIDVLEAMKCFRNITFVTYCNGASTFNKIENILKTKMLEIGYKESEINMILSQICLAAISGNVIQRKGTSTLTYVFGDTNDIDYDNNPEVKEGMSELGEGYINYGDSLGYAVSGDGEHSFKRHMTEDPVLSARISTFINTSLDNAIDNTTNEVIDPITYEKMENAFELEKDTKRI